MTQKERSYQAFLRAVKRSEGLNQKEAIRAYKGMGDRLNRPPTAKDLTAHPRIAKAEIIKSTAPAPKRATRPPAPAPAKKGKGKTAPAPRPRAAPKKAPAKKAPAKKKAAPKKAIKKAAKKAVAPRPPAKKKAPAKKGENRILHAGVQYRRGKTDRHGRSDNVRVELVIELTPTAQYDPATLNRTLQEYAQTGELPRGWHVEMMRWQHGEQAPGETEERDEINEARTMLLARIAGAGKFEDMGTD